MRLKNVTNEVLDFDLRDFVNYFYFIPGEVVEIESEVIAEALLRMSGGNLELTDEEEGLSLQFSHSGIIFNNTHIAKELNHKKDMIETSSGVTEKKKGVTAKTERGRPRKTK